MTITQLCVSVQSTTSTVQPGQTAQFAINVWPLGGAANSVTVQISAQPSSFGAPVFTLCPSGDGTQTCTLGTVTKATALQARLAVPWSAPAGQSATLTATATGVASGATASGSVAAIGSFTVVAPPPPPSSPPPPPPHHNPPPAGHGQRHSHGSGSGSTPTPTPTPPNGTVPILSPLGTGLGGGSPLGGLLPLTGVSSTGSGANPGTLFPTINPSAGPSGSGVAGTGTKASHSTYHARNVADILPLNTRQLGSQVAGLVVLVIGIVIAVARVSLRKPRTQNK